MIAVHLDKITFTYVAEPVFENLTWEIHDDRVVGLIGPNGCGKSTLMRLIYGDLAREAGFLTRQTGLTLGYLPQESGLNPENTVWEEVAAANTDLRQVEADLARLEASLADPEVYGNEKRLGRALDDQARLLEKFTALGGPGFDGHVRATLFSLGFEEQDFSLPIQALSGGQKKLVGLARLLIPQPKLLLLDEPDNHLDIPGKDFLANLIRNYPGAVVLISHDRYLLDLVVDEIAELEDGKLTTFPGNYSEYAFEKQARLLREQQRFQVQQKEINRLEQSAKRLLMWGKNYDNEKFIRRGKNILKRIERMDKIDRPTLERKRMGLDLAGWRGSNKVLEIQELEKSFQESIPTPDSHPMVETRESGITLFSGLEATIWHGERAGLVGPNGSGKSMLFKMILGQEGPASGAINLGPSVKIGYYAQEHETLDYAQSLIEVVRYAAPLSESQAVAFLGRFLFSYEQARGLVQNLSGGERSRLQMALLMLSGANFLLLDEPTNNLDIPSAEALEDALAEFEGTALVISHDRYFLDRVAGRILAIENKALEEYTGNYSDYLEQSAVSS